MPVAGQSTLTAAPRGGFVARKVIPRDVSEAYAARFNDGKPLWEAWFNSGPLKLLHARAMHREWLSEIEARIGNIRAERSGEGSTLTPQGARALAGQWYAWFTSNKWPRTDWGAYRDHCWDGVWAALDNPGGRSFADVDMPYLRPFIADEAKTAQFLSAKRLTLDAASRDLFLNYVAQDFFAALDLLVRRAEGDFGEDEYAKRFPKVEGVADGGAPHSQSRLRCQRAIPAWRCHRG